MYQSRITYSPYMRIRICIGVWKITSETLESQQRRQSPLSLSNWEKTDLGNYGCSRNGRALAIATHHGFGLDHAYQVGRDIRPIYQNGKVASCYAVQLGLAIELGKEFGRENLIRALPRL